MFNPLQIAAIIVCYFIGNISPAILIGRLTRGIDIRKEGSGNAGATNVLRVLGKKAAVATLFLDIIKGVAAVLIGRYIGGSELALICGLAVLLGHIWPAVFSFRGGKGIATAFGVVVALEPLLGVIAAAIALMGIFISRRVSVGSIISATALPLIAYLFDPKYFPWLAVMAVIILFKHRMNIVRLLKGEEPKVSFSKQEEKDE